MKTIERNYRKTPHTASFLKTFHSGISSTGRNYREELADAPATREARCLECQGFHPGGASCGPADDLLDLVPEAEIVDLRSPSQANFMESLIRQISDLDAKLGEAARKWTNDATAAGHWTPGRTGNASAWITRMIAKLAELKAATPKTTAPAAELEDGIYFYEGSIYKVVHAIHGSGRQYAKILTPPLEDGENGTWDRAPGMIAKLRAEHKMTLADAEKYGALYGCCVRCGRGLTKESSIAQAMGDKCASKF